MKIKMLFTIFVGLLFLAACSQEAFPELHKEYLANKGWEIKELIEVETSTLEIPDEMLSNDEASGITFLSDYLGKEVTEYSYELKEKDIEGEHLKAAIFEVEGEIIGSFGILPSWTPGVINLDEREHLINEQMIMP